jgi:hypothetical protein
MQDLHDKAFLERNVPAKIPLAAVLRFSELETGEISSD